MPETPLTPYCNHMYDLVQRVRDFIDGAVAPAINAQLRLRERSTRKRDNAIQITFVRVVRWLTTFKKLNLTVDLQAVGAGARGVFEHYLDLKWFEQKPEEKYLDRFWAFPEVDRYRAAKKIVDHAATRTSGIDTAPHQEFIRQMDAQEPMSAKVARIWGTHPKTGQPLWPRDHWTGEGKLPQRTKLLGPDCEDMYVQIYSTLCALVHPGPTPEVGQVMGDFDWLEQQIAFAYFLTFQNARSATFLTCDLLNVRQHVEGIDTAARVLREWEEQACALLPNAPAGFAAPAPSA